MRPVPIFLKLSIYIDINSFPGPGTSKITEKSIFLFFCIFGIFPALLETLLEILSRSYQDPFFENLTGRTGGDQGCVIRGQRATNP